MKKIRRKILTVFLGASVMANPMNVRASEQSVTDSVVLVMLIDKGTEEVALGVAGVAVEKNGLSWVISASEIQAFSTDDYDFLMITSNGENAWVYPVTDDNSAAVFYSETPVNLPALPLGTELDVSHELYSVTPSGIEDGKISYSTKEVSGFTECNGGYLLGNKDNASSLWVGTPVLDMDTASVTGIGTLSGDGEFFKDITSDSYYEELALENWGKLGDSQEGENSSKKEETDGTGKEAAREDGTGKEAVREEETGKEAAREEETGKAAEKEEPAPEEPQKESSSGIQLDESTIWLVALITVGIVLWLLMRKKSSSGSGEKKSSSGSREDSYSLDLSQLQEKQRSNGYNGDRLHPMDPFETMQKGYRLEGVSGALAGQRFRLEGVVRIGRDPQSCRVLYPADTKGISRNHCTVELRDGKILIKDLNSTHGTYFENGERLQPEISYHVQSGTMFYLAESKNMFRITDEGWR